MCELLAISSRVPTSVGFVLERLALRGGIEGPSRDGWGAAFYEDSDVLIVKEPGAAANSGLANYLEHHTPPSGLVMSHIRRAVFGERALRNTQPFQRELGGRAHIFAHNGSLPAIQRADWIEPGGFVPLGETDSEIVFCGLMNRLRSVWTGAGEHLPSLEARLGIVSAFAAEIRELGPANFLYSDSDILFAHGHRRKQPDGAIAPPGLHVLQHRYAATPGRLSSPGVVLHTVCRDTTLVATVPLTDGDWRPLGEGEVLAVRRGSIIGRQEAPLAGPLVPQAGALPG